MKKALVTGASGQLGNCILREYSSDSDITWVGLNREDLDITNSDQIRRVVEEHNPDFIVNTAAYTAVDKAESEFDKANAINYVAVSELSKICAGKGIKLIHISTDYVYKGDGTSEIDPVNAYGKSKFEGEKAVVNAFSGGGRYYVLRTSWLYDYEGRNFFNTMRGLKSARVVNDQFGVPTWAGALAAAIRRVVLRSDEIPSGIYDFSEVGRASWYDFAKEIFDRTGSGAEITAVGTEEFPTVAKRPVDSTMDGSKLRELLNLETVSWKESLQACIDDMKLWEEVTRKAEVWSKEPYDASTREIVGRWIAEDRRNDLIEAFHKDMEFGTGGMRGVCGPGTNRINNATIAQATQGLANYLKANEEGELKVAIAYDCRHQSEELSAVVARVLAGNGIKALIYPALRPTPQLSFTVRDLDCTAGVVITASHNPPEYNGFKVYYSDGGQIVPPHDNGIIDEVRKIEGLHQVSFAEGKELIQVLGSDMDEKFRKKIMTLKSPEVFESIEDEVVIAFTGLHGTGSVSVPGALSEFGFKKVFEVQSQSIPDGSFPTVLSPNPEEGQALEEAISLGKSVDADVVMGTDPDADRVGIAVPSELSPTGFELLNGNETGALLFDYVLSKGAYNSSHFVASTVVTTPLLKKIADSYGVGYVETLTGFKHIANAINTESREYVIGAEESYGYLIGDTARDKDAVAACCVIAELSQNLKNNGFSMLAQLEAIHRKWGLYVEGLKSVTKKGRDGAAEISAMMDEFRNNTPKSLGGEAVVEMRDFSDGSVPKLPKSNVLQLITDKGSIVTVRPSGTEPKIKFYVSVNRELSPDEDYIKAKQELKQKIDGLLLAFLS